MKMSLILFLVLCSNVLFSQEHFKVSLKGYDPKSCLFLSEDQKHIMFIEPEIKDRYNGILNIGSLAAVEFGEYVNGSSAPSGLRCYEDNIFKEYKIHSVTAISSNPDDTHPMCIVYENGEAYCRRFQATPTKRQFNEAVPKLEVLLEDCDLFFLREGRKIPRFNAKLYRSAFGDKTRNNHRCVIRVKLEETEKIEKIVFTDQLENEANFDKSGAISSYNYWRQSHRTSGIRTLCFQTNKAELKCLGSNLGIGILGNESNDDLYPPIPDENKMRESYLKRNQYILDMKVPKVDVGAEVVDSCISTNYACAILKDGALKCWGDTQIGNGASFNMNFIYDKKVIADLITRHRTKNVVGNQKNQMGKFLKSIPLGNNMAGRKAVAKKIDCSYSHFCVTLDDSNIRCFGSNESGQLGTGSDTKSFDLKQLDSIDKKFPIVEIVGESTVTQTVTQGGSTCAVLDTGHLSCFGRNESSILGYPSDSKKYHIFVNDKDIFPIVPIDRLNGIVGMCMMPPTDSYYRQACVVYSDSRVRCWNSGWNSKKNVNLDESSLFVEVAQ